MPTAVARMLFATVIVVALLATGCVLSVYHAGDVPLAAVFTALGTAIPLVLRYLMSASTEADKDKPDKGGTGSAAVLLVVGSVLAGHVAGCAPPTLPPRDCSAVGFREGDEACMRQYSAEGERIACRRANARACGVVFTPSPEAAK